jgi:hypothetical protein
MNAATLDKKLHELELRAGYLMKLAGERKENPAVWRDMQKMAATLLAQDSSEEDDGDEDDDEDEGDEETQGQEQQEQQVKSANLDAFRQNSDVASTIIDHVGETSEKITKLVQAGRKFNAAKARSDLHKIMAQVEEILAQTDLGQPWVGAALQKLAADAEHIHSLFAPVNV